MFPLSWTWKGCYAFGLFWNNICGREESWIERKWNTFLLNIILNIYGTWNVLFCLMFGMLNLSWKLCSTNRMTFTFEKIDETQNLHIHDSLNKRAQLDTLSIGLKSCFEIIPVFIVLWNLYLCLQVLRLVCFRHDFINIWTVL